MSSRSKRSAPNTTIVLFAVTLLALSGCNGDDEGGRRPQATATPTTAAATGTPTLAAPPTATATRAATSTMTPMPTDTTAPTATPTATPTPTATQAPGTEFVASLDGDQEVPAVVGIGSGTAALTLNASRTELAFEVDIDGLDPAEITQAHLHVAPGGFNGPVVAFLTGDPPFTLPLRGMVTGADVLPNPDVSVATFADLVDALEAGDVYVNVHTMDNPGGEIRGQVRGPATFVSTLSGDQEVPAVVGIGSGTAALTLNASRTELAFEVEIDGLDPAEITQAHLHVAPGGFNGPVVAFLTGDPPFTLPLRGTITGADVLPNPDVGVATFADLVDALEAGDVYVNVHTMDNPGGEIRGQVDAPLRLPAMLSGDQESEPVETGASGVGQVVLSADRRSLRFALGVSGLPADQITQAHIHVGPPGVDGPVVLFLSATSFSSPRVGTLVENDLIPSPDAGVNTFADFVQALLDGDAYMNVHSVAHQGGEIRGQIQAPLLFAATLTGDQEETPVDTEATGTGQVVLSADRGSLRFALSVFDLPADQITQAHIHVGEPGMNGPVVLFLSPESFGSPLLGTLTADDLIPSSMVGVETFADFLERLRAGQTYMNVHTQAHMGGEVRGQLLP